MDQSYLLQYKCRSCGEIFGIMARSDTEDAVEYVRWAINHPGRMHAAHKHIDESVGVADLIGIREA